MKVFFIAFYFSFKVLFSVYGQTDAVFKDSLESKDPDIVFEKCKSLAKEKKYDEAEYHLLKIIRKYPHYVDIRVYLASVYSWQNKFEVASKQLDTALIESPSNTYALITKARLHYYQSQFQESIQSLSKIPPTPIIIDAIELKIQCHEILHQYDSAHLENGKLKDTSPQKYKSNKKRLTVDEYQYLPIVLFVGEDFLFPVENATQIHTLTFLGGKRLTKKFTYLFQINYRNAFSKNDFQFLNHMYYQPSKKFSFYFSAGVTPSVQLFPEYQADFELSYLYRIKNIFKAVFHFREYDIRSFYLPGFSYTRTISPFANLSAKLLVDASSFQNSVEISTTLFPWRNEIEYVKLSTNYSNFSQLSVNSNILIDNPSTQYSFSVILKKIITRHTAIVASGYYAYEYFSESSRFTNWVGASVGVEIKL